MSDGFVLYCELGCYIDLSYLNSGNIIRRMKQSWKKETRHSLPRISHEGLDVKCEMEIQNLSPEIVSHFSQTSEVKNNIEGSTKLRHIFLRGRLE